MAHGTYLIMVVRLRHGSKCPPFDQTKRQLREAKGTKLRELNLPDNKLSASGVEAVTAWLSSAEAPRITKVIAF